MAYGYAYEILGDFHLAEDAAQAAFITAFERLETLREPEAFPGWFRRIVQTTCVGLTRGKRLPLVPLEAAADAPSPVDDPARTAERRELSNQVLDAVRSLPEPEREVTTLFFINGYSQKDISGFLEIPVSTVKNRLFASKKRLRERMTQMVADELKSHKLPEGFTGRARLLLELPRPLGIADHPVRRMWELFRGCVPEFDLVELDEVCSRHVSLLHWDNMADYIYRVDEERILRPELTSQMLAVWLARGGGPCRLVTVGRVFRKGHQPETTTMLEVHHQAEVLWVEKGLTEETFHQTMRRISTTLLPNVPCEPETGCHYVPVPNGVWYTSPWQGRMLHTAAGGMVSADWLAKGGVNPVGFGGISFAFGLERVAQVALNLDDIRKLWQPPYLK